MIPSMPAFMGQGLAIREQPSRTYGMNMEDGTVQGYVDGLEAMRQAVYKVLLTERYQYPMYSWDYGVELADLFGEPVSYVCPELERRITEALLQDGRIEGVDGFSFSFPRKGTVHVSFTVHTIFGDIEAEREVGF